MYIECIFENLSSSKVVARVVRELGDRRLIVYCEDNIIRLTRIPGSLHRLHWIKTVSDEALDCRIIHLSKGRYGPRVHISHFTREGVRLVEIYSQRTATTFRMG
jgi:hypothetical protein